MDPPTMAPSRIWFKVHGAHREPDGTFRIKGRLLDATVALRTTIERIILGPSPRPSPPSGEPDGGVT